MSASKGFLFSFFISALSLFMLASILGFVSDFDRKRETMVRTQIEARGVRDSRVLEAMRKVERHLFVPKPLRLLAYADQPLPIGEGQTISQPYIVALMTELLSVKPGDRVLEIGTGSGYQAAVLAELAQEVYSIEIIPKLADRAAKQLSKLGYANVHVKAGDGFLGWPEKAPFDGIILTSAPGTIPQPLIDQLKIGGRMVIPMGELSNQILYLVRKSEKGLEREEVIPVRFVPMTGIAEDSQ